MLEKIIIDNFASFINETTIDFKATNYKFLESDNVGENRILKGALFIGENASGKTKVLMAIKLLLDLMFSNDDIDLMVNQSLYTKKNNYSLKYFFTVENSKLEYDLEIAKGKIVKEKLILDDKEIINRIGISAVFNLNDEKTFDDLDEKLSFVRRVYFDTKFYDDAILNKWFDFLKNSKYVNCYTRFIRSYNSDKLLVHSYLDKYGTKEINDFFKKINYKERIEYDKSKKIISFIKEGTNILIPEIYESTGNNTLIHLIPIFLQVIKTDAMIILDEFSSGFHNELEECLVKFFYHYANNSQLFFVSHSTNILNNTIIRPDQIYTVSFNSKKGSFLKRFSDEMPREAQNIEKMYLNGVFDGMPRYNKIFKD